MVRERETSENNKHLMTGPKANSEFCFPETPMLALGNIEVKGRQNSMFPTGPVIKCFVIPPNSKNNNKKNAAVSRSMS